MENINKEIINKLEQFKNGQEFVLFSQKIIKTNKSMLGVKTPVLRSVAKELYLKYEADFVKELDYSNYELSVIGGLVIALEKDFEKATVLLDMFLSHVDNWAEIDLVSGDLKMAKVKSQKERCFEYFETLTKSSEPFAIRMGVVSLMKYYSTGEYLEKTLKIVESIKSEHYYVEMAIAWLLSDVLIKASEPYAMATEVFGKYKFSKFVVNKALSKTRDSFRVSKEQKQKLKGLKYAEEE